MKPAKTAGLITRLREFFAQNPGEELSIEDAREKFGATVGNLRTSLLYLRGRDEVEVIVRPKRSQS